MVGAVSGLSSRNRSPVFDKKGAYQLDRAWRDQRLGFKSPGAWKEKMQIKSQSHYGSWDRRQRRQIELDLTDKNPKVIEILNKDKESGEK